MPEPILILMPGIGMVVICAITRKDTKTSKKPPRLLNIPPANERLSIDYATRINKSGLRL